MGLGFVDLLTFFGSLLFFGFSSVSVRLSFFSVLLSLLKIQFGRVVVVPWEIPKDGAVLGDARQGADGRVHPLLYTVVQLRKGTAPNVYVLASDALSHSHWESGREISGH